MQCEIEVSFIFNGGIRTLTLIGSTGDYFASSTYPGINAEGDSWNALRDNIRREVMQCYKISADKIIRVEIPENL